jgi:hypothetical protein
MRLPLPTVVDIVPSALPSAKKLEGRQQLVEQLPDAVQ